MYHHRAGNRDDPFALLASVTHHRNGLLNGRFHLALR
jgi:hypothetical protein